MTTSFPGEFFVTANGQKYPAGLAAALWPTVDLVGAAHSLASSDQHKCLRISHTALSTLTVPPQSQVAFPDGAVILVEWAIGTAGPVAVAEGAGVDIDTAETFELRKPGSVGCLRHDSGNRWSWFGDLNLA